VTCISPLLPAERIECHVLEACDLALEKTQVYDRGPTVVLALDVTHARTLDAEDRQALAVHASDLDVAQLAAADEPEGPQEQILGLEHGRLPWSHAHGLPEESWAMVGSIEVSPSLL
jgi:hypothetical protein